ncbi:ABC transporter permease [Devosia epidermidihirudinis]|nr:ABC transporter permease subunit [Devosia epidermidihirudinis]
MAAVAKKSRRASASRKRTMVLLLMCLPALIWLLLFKYATLAGSWIAFTNFRPRLGIFGSEFVGLRNFEFLFSSAAALNASRNTILLNGLFIVGSTIFTLFISALMFEVFRSRFAKYYQTTFLFPYFISWVIVSYFVFGFLSSNGIVNGILSQPIEFYQSPGWWPLILLLVVIWKTTGWGTLIYLAGMLAINPQLYEASRVDGASKVQQFFTITLPLIMPLVIIQFLLSLANIFNADFGLFYQVPLNQALLYDSTDVLDTFIYRALVQVGNVSMSAAADLYKSVIGFVLVIVANWVVRRIDPDKALF